MQAWLMDPFRDDCAVAPRHTSLLSKLAGSASGTCIKTHGQGMHPPEQSHMHHVVLGVQERSLSASSEWRRQIQAVDQQILSTLREQISGGFDEAAYGDRMGFASLKR